MTTPDEDEAWRLIVDNYGETATRDVDLPPLATSDSEPGPPEPAAPVVEEPAGPTPEPDASTDVNEPGDETRPGPYLGPAEDEAPLVPAWLDSRADEGRFVPPTPPPAPPMPWPRRAAWAGVFAAPVVFVLAVMTNAYLPRPFIAFLVIGLVAGFGYLVLTMPKDPPDPWDDGSRV